jgi:hypothetical protein
MRLHFYRYLVEKKTNKFKETPSAEFDFEILFVPASWL